MKIAVWALALAAVGATASPETAVSRVIVPATAADPVFALYPKVTPTTVAQFLEQNGAPALQLTISHGEAAETPEALGSKTLRRAIPLEAGVRGAPRQLPPSGRSAWNGLGLVLVLLGLALGATVILGKGLRPALLLSALIGGFTLFLYLAPLSAGRPWLATAIFLGTAALFRVLSLFESPSRGRSKARPGGA